MGRRFELDPELLPRLAAEGVLVRRYRPSRQKRCRQVFLTAVARGHRVRRTCRKAAILAPVFSFVDPMTKAYHSRWFPRAASGVSLCNFGKAEKAQPLFLRLFWSWSVREPGQVPDSPA